MHSKGPKKDPPRFERAPVRRGATFDTHFCFSLKFSSVVSSVTSPTQTTTAIVSLPTTPAPHAEPAQSKASLSTHPLDTPSLALPPAHPAAGVASVSAGHSISSSAASSALAPSNVPAQMTSELSKKSGDKRVSAAAVAPAPPPKDKGMVQFVERDGHFSLVRNFHLADAFTLMNGFCGAQSLFHSGKYLLTSDPRHAWFALWFPLFGAIFDLLDGKVARWRKSSSMLGQELDSLADLVSITCCVGCLVVER